MDTWASYALSDFLMFSPASYFRRYELANADLWPGHLLLAMVAVALAWLMRRSQLRSVFWIGVLLAAAWALVATGYLHRHYAQISLAANGFALAFGLQALMMLLWGINEARRQPLSDPRPAHVRYPGMALFAYALLLHPLVGLLAGRSWRGIELFGIAPDPTALATVGILLTGLRTATWPLLLIPLAWCGISALTYLAMGHVYGVTPLVLAISALAVAIALHYAERKLRGAQRQD